jgi:hypothetical protein
MPMKSPRARKLPAGDSRSLDEATLPADTPGADLLDRSLDETERSRLDGPGWPTIGGIVIGRLVTVREDGAPLVEYPVSPALCPAVAVSTVPVMRADADRQVALAFAGGDPSRPIILGFIHQPEPPAAMGVVAAAPADG